MTFAYRFQLESDVPFEEAEGTLNLAIIAMEGLYGSSAVQMDARYRVECPAILVDGSTELGQRLARLLSHLLRCEFGKRCCGVTRIVPPIPLTWTVITPHDN